MSNFDVLADSEQSVILQFIDHLWMENGLSANTLSAYRNDMANFSMWLTDNNQSLVEVKTLDIQSFLAHRFECGTAVEMTVILGNHRQRRPMRAGLQSGHVLDHQFVGWGSVQDTTRKTNDLLASVTKVTLD